MLSKGVVAFLRRPSGGLINQGTELIFRETHLVVERIPYAKF